MDKRLMFKVTLLLIRAINQLALVAIELCVVNGVRTTEANQAVAYTDHARETFYQLIRQAGYSVEQIEKV